jgi:hypothetical protein
MALPVSLFLDRVAGIEDRLGRSVVLFECYDLGGRIKRLWKGRATWAGARGLFSTLERKMQEHGFLDASSTSRFTAGRNN